MTLFAGRYVLEQKLASGGMAEVFLARQKGLEGFEKRVVVKRILPHQAENPEFVRMFLDEVRLSADLHHPNIVSLFDAGVSDGQYFIAMEYLRGRDVAAIFHELTRKKLPLPLDVGVHAVVEASRGLHAAHSKLDLDGKPLHIVHRDVSPPNLFVTWDGITKVLDFGIAHASVRSSKTEVGVVKGKLAYLSPEQLEAQPLDGRADQFALGVVAWELLTGHRLFQKPSDAEALRAILEHKIPAPSKLRADIPPALEALVLKMLAADRRDRFPDCAAAADAFEDWLDESRTPHSTSRVARALQSLFPDPVAAAPAPPQQPTKETVLPPRASAPTRPNRAKVSLPQEDAFLSAVSSFLKDRPGRTNLLPPVGAWIGRERELAGLESWLNEPETRLVTVTGFGGVGKTRLVRELAWRQRNRFAAHGGTWFIDLSAARSVDDLCKALSLALSVDVASEGQTDSITKTGRTLRSLGEALVVLDNFEQLVAVASRTLGEWLELAPELHFVVTSRESLRLPLERVFRLTPLPAAGEASEAVQLFLSRAESAGVSVRADEKPIVAAICERLEGHALAIELAAAQLATVSPQRILEQLAGRQLLKLGEGTGRHDSLWNAVDWSWQLLSPVEQSALAQLSVFRGGFTAEAAVEVVELTQFPVAPTRIDVVSALQRKSLLAPSVAPELPHELRLGMLEVVHEFAALQLEQQGAVEGARRRHAGFRLTQGEDALSRLGTDGTEAAMNELFVERANVTEVFERALATLPPTTESATTALRALSVLEPVVARTGPYTTHLALLDDALRVGRQVGVNAEILANGYRQRGNGWRVRGLLPQAVEDLTQALTLARATTAQPLLARVLTELAVARFVSGQLDPALEGLEEGLAVARAADDRATLLETLAYLAIVRVARHEPAAAIVHCDEALPLARERGDRLNEARLLGTMGSIFQDQGRLELANAFLRDAVERCRDIREVRLQGFFLGKLAHLLLERGERSKVRTLLTESLELLSGVGDVRHEGLFLTYLATLESFLGHTNAARTALGSAKVRLDSVKDPLLLTTLALRSMVVELGAANASRTEAQALLDDVRAARESRSARVNQSEEVRLAARVLESALRAP